MTDILHQSTGFFEDPDQAQRGILPLQADPSGPALPQLESATGLLSPDRSTQTRLSHFSPDLYDLRPQSHLVRFMKALLGDAGVGQLRKRYTVARLQTAFTSTHFYDLDRFYGAIFGAQRRVSEQLPINPMSGTAEPAEWDDIESRDALYRERLSALSKAIPMAGTIPGIQQAAEALAGVECDIYESWPLIDLYGPGATPPEQIGFSELGSRSEVYVRVKKQYLPVDNTPESVAEAERQRAEDEMALLRVLNLLKPAGVHLVVDTQDMAIQSETPIARLSADSEYWEVMPKVHPRPDLVGGTTETYPVSPVGGTGSTLVRTLPLPPFSRTQADEWTYNPAIVSMQSYSMGNDGEMLNANNYDLVGSGSTVVAYTPDKGLADPRSLIAARLANDGMMAAHPYAGPRTAVPTHD